MKLDSIMKAYKGMLFESTILSEEMLMENRLEWIKKNTPALDTSHDPHGEHKDTADIVDHFAEKGDPTKKKVHTQYLVALYKNKALRQEDAYRAHSTLSDFEAYKNKLSPDDKQLTVKRYPNLATINDKVAPFIGTGSTNAEAAKIAQSKEYDSPEHEKVWEDDKIKIYRLNDKDTSQKLYGKSNDKNPGVFPTDWCTATQQDEHNMFDHYSKQGPIHVIHRKSDGAVFQYHQAADQFMDKDDKEISSGDFESFKDSLHKAWDEKPELLK